MIQADLLGDEVVPSTPVNGQPTATVQSNQDLLAEIFGPSTSMSSVPTNASSPPMQPERSKVDDILNLFGTSGNLPSAPATPHPSAVPPSYSPPSSLFTPTQAQAQSPPTPAVVAQPRLTSYTAYDKNDIKITLTPQTSATRPGVVMILARFQVYGGEAATGLSFQAAVPKVRL
jgi:AP-1 complex subunit gamma-1